MKISKKILLVFLIAFMSIASFSVTSLIEITPGSISFGTVLREGFSQSSFKFSTYSDFPATITINNSGQDNLMNGWIYLHSANGSEINSEDKFNLDKNHSLIIFVTFEPSSDASNGNYETTIRATIEENPGNDSILGGEPVARIKTSMLIKLSGTVNNVESLSCSATNLEINNPENGESVVFNSRIKNTGNIILDPRLEIEIWDKDKTKLIKKVEGNLGTIKPTINAETQFEFNSSDLSQNEYVASVSLKQCNIENKIMSFKILETGTKREEGKIKLIDILSISYGFKPIRVRVNFENYGNNSVTSQAICHIYKDNVEIAPLPVSEKSFIVKSKESVNIDLGYFTPVQTKNYEERYVAKCYVNYGNKKTEEYSKVFFVKKEELKKSNNPLILITGMIILILILMAIIVKRNK